jgi:hypothetical protein
VPLHRDGKALGWLGYIAFDPDEEEEPTVLFYCPVCAARENFAPPLVEEYT